MKNYLIPSTIILVLAVVILDFAFQKPLMTMASVPQGGSYKEQEIGQTFIGLNNQVSVYATSTVLSPVPGATNCVPVINTAPCPGVLGSIIVTGTSTGSFILYDSSTTDATMRTPYAGSTATSSLRVLAQIVAGEPAGTYVFDSAFYNGLIISINGTAPTSTITYTPY